MFFAFIFIFEIFRRKVLELRRQKKLAKRLKVFLLQIDWCNLFIIITD
jgi:hypothetical protein